MLHPDRSVIAHMRQVYSPHTAVDAASGGLGDWLADIVTGKLSEPEPETQTADKIEPPSPKTVSSEDKVSSEDDPFMDAKSSSEAPRPPLPPRAYLQRTYSKPTYPIPKNVDKTDLSP